MNTSALFLAISSVVISLDAKPTLKSSIAIDEKVLADSLKKASAKLSANDTSKSATSATATPASTAPTAPAKTAVVVAPTLAKAVDSASKVLPPAVPTKTAQPSATSASNPPIPPVVRPPVTPPLPSPNSLDSLVVKKYKILDRPLNREEIKYFLSAFRMGDTEKPDSSAGHWSIRDKQGAALIYGTGKSELGYSNSKAAFLMEKDRVPDSLIRKQTDAVLRGIMQDKYERYTFANYEITMVQRKEGDGQGKIYDPEPAFYYGRYIRKLDNRLILGDAFQIRLGIGAQGALESFSFRDPVVAEGGSLKVPSREFVLDSLKRWERSKTHTRAYVYPYHPDHLNIRSLKPVKAFESYILTDEKFRDTPNMSGAYLVPVVTVLAQVLVNPPKQKPSEPVPTEPVLLHFHFPCHPEAGLCWPDGNRDLQGAVIPPSNKPKVNADSTAKTAPKPLIPK